MDKISIYLVKIKNMNKRNIILIFLLIIVLLLLPQIGFALGFISRHIWEFFMLLIERLPWR